MRKVKSFFCLALICAFIGVLGTSSFISKADYLDVDYLVVSSVTTNSITVDITGTINKVKNRNPGSTADPYEIRVRIWNNSKNNSLIKTIPISADQSSYKITGLKSGKRYNIGLYYHYKNAKSSVSFDLSSEGNYTTRKKDEASYALTLLGRTDTKMYVSAKAGIEQLKKDCEAKKYTDFQPGYFFWGHAAESKKVNTKQALNKARKIALKADASDYHDKEKLYTNLKADTGQAFCLLLVYSYKDDKGTLQIAEEYLELSGVKTDVSGAYTADEVGDTSKGKWINNKSDKTIGNKSVTECMSIAYFNTTATDNSITVDWSKCEYLTGPGGGKNKYLVAVVEDTDYDPFADMEKNGYDNNWGPNVRKAIKSLQKATKNNSVAKGKKSFTVDKLKKGTRYVVVLKCGYKTNNYKSDTTYIVDRVTTTGGSGALTPEADIYKNYQKGYMFDAKVKREGNTYLLDWEDARNQFMAQDIFKKYTLKEDTTYDAFIYAVPVSDCKTNDELKKAYFWSHYGDMVERVKRPCTRARVYGLDTSKKYVFVIRVEFCFYSEGSLSYLDEYFYVDETGMNYYHKNALGLIEDDPAPSEPEPQPSDPEPTPDTPTPSDPEPAPSNPEPAPSDPEPVPVTPQPSEPAPTPATPQPSVETPESSATEPSTSGQSASNTSTTEASQTNQEASEDSTSNNVTGETTADQRNVNVEAGTAAENLNNAETDSDNEMILVGKKADNRAWVYVSTKKLAASELKKKAKKVNIKVENSAGKITTKNISSAKLKKYAKVKVGKRDISLKFKKGAPKGTYKFKVTVAAKGSTKKTTTTVKVVVE